jgi:multicomponent Na+:H+ antiporter subunit E
MRVRTRSGLAFVRRGVLFGGIWLVLTSGDPSSWIPGGITAAIASLLSLRLLPSSVRRVKWAAVVLFLPGFVQRSIAGGLDVASRAVKPRMPVDPGWFRYRTELPAGTPQVIFGNIISLLPGTLAAGSIGNDVLVHCLDRAQPMATQLAREERGIAAVIATNH